MSELNVLITDDHGIVRAGLSAVIDGLAGIRVADQAADGDQAVRIVERAQALGQRIDVVLMDLQMGGGGKDGVPATARIRALPDPPVVLVLTTYDTDSDILAALDAGASGYLLKDAGTAELERGIRASARGETVLAPSVAARLVGRARTPAVSLSAREIELLQLLGQGLTNRVIAKQLFISEATVKTHLVHIYGKLGVDNRTAAISEAVRRNIIKSATGR